MAGAIFGLSLCPAKAGDHPSLSLFLDFPVPFFSFYLFLQVPFLHRPRAAPQALVSPTGGLLHTFRALVLRSGYWVFVATTLGMPLDYPALEARRACTIGSHRSVPVTEAIHGELCLPGHRTVR